MDAFDAATDELLAANARTISQLSHDVETLLTALARAEGLTPRQVAYRHLGRCEMPINPRFHPN